MGQRRNIKRNLNYFQVNENKNTSYQNLCDAAKTVLSGKFMLLDAYIRKEERTKINHLSKVEKEEQIISKVREENK